MPRPELTLPNVRPQPASLARRMAAALPHLRESARSRGLHLHHLAAGYPNPEVTDPRTFLAKREAYFRHLTHGSLRANHAGSGDVLSEAFAYTDTLGPSSVREVFAEIYGGDWGVALDPGLLIPTMGATGGINLACSMFERLGVPIAYITDAPTYTGFLARASLNRDARIYSVELDTEGPIIERFREQIQAARSDGRFIAFYYTVPDGHNPAGFSFSSIRRHEILDLVRQEQLLIVEDAPYLYISYEDPSQRSQPFLALAPEQTIHLFSASKIGWPGPRVGFIYSAARVHIDGHSVTGLADLLLREASADVLCHNPEALRGFEALLHDDQMRKRASLWPLAEEKLAVYRENRKIAIDALRNHLADWTDCFSWTEPQAGFFIAFRFHRASVRANDHFAEHLAEKYGIVTISMREFFPADAHARNPDAGRHQLRLSFSFTERTGWGRTDDLHRAITAFCHAARVESNLPGLV